jgi:hypothetical protein
MLVPSESSKGTLWTKLHKLDTKAKQKTEKTAQTRYQGETMTVRATYITTDKYISAPQVRSTHFVSLLIMFDARQLAVISSYLSCCIAIFHDDTLLATQSGPFSEKTCIDCQV